MDKMVDWDKLRIFHAVAEEGPGMKIAMLAVIALGHEFPPCGACRQVIAEFATEKTEVWFLQGGRSVAMSMMDGTGEDEHVLIRGNSSNPGRSVARRFLAAVDGPARAGGIGLMAACDLVVVNRSVSFALTEVRIGVAPAIDALDLELLGAECLISLGRDDEARARQLAEIYHPYQAAIGDWLDANLTRRPILVSLHSFTPSMNGKDWDKILARYEEAAAPGFGFGPVARSLGGSLFPLGFPVWAG